MTLEPGTPVVVGDRVVPFPALGPGDRVLAVQATGDLLRIPRGDWEEAAAAAAAAQEAFEAMAEVPDDAVTRFFDAFAERLAHDPIWAAVAEANAADVERARASGRSITRLAATEKMRWGMVEGLRGWARAKARRGEVIERRDAGTWSVERRRAPLGVVAFVFEGRPNVLADGVGVLRGGNTAVMRIGSDALGTAEAIADHALGPALEAAGLPRGAVTLLRSRSHAAAQALFCMPQVRLAVARGSGPAVRLLGAIAAQHGIPASLHGTGGGWMYVCEDAAPPRVRSAVRHSVDRKVCNTLNVVVVAEAAAGRLVPAVLEGLADRDPGFRLHAAGRARDVIPRELFDRQVVVRRAGGARPEPQADAIELGDLATEWEWEETPEVSLALAASDAEAVELINTYSPKLVVSVLTSDEARFERLYARIDAPFVGDGFTRWVDGQWAWERPELGLTNWERGRVMGRSGILSGDDVYAVRDVFRDRTAQAPQRR